MKPHHNRVLERRMVVICVALLAAVLLNVLAWGILGLGWWAGIGLLIALLVGLPLVAAFGASLSRRRRPVATATTSRSDVSLRLD